MSYDLTKSRIIQWIGIILILCLFGGAYWYFNVRAGVKQSTGGTQPQGTGDLSSGLAGYWKLDDGSGSTAVDSSTNANNGTLTNGPTWGTGQIGGDVVFDGTDDYISIGDPGALRFGATSFAVSGWVKTTTTSKSNVVCDYNVSNTVIELGLNDGGHADKAYLKLSNTTASNIQFIYSNKSINDGQWHHLVGIRNSDTGYMSLYIDGALDATSVYSSAASFATLNSWSIGRAGSYPANYLNGSIDEVRIYSRSLSADEVSQLYRLTTPTGVDTSLKGYWSFNGKDLSGTTAYDRSGAGNNGTLTNGPAITEGKIGQGLSFDGSNDYVSVADTAALSPAVNDITLSVWAKVPTTASSVGTGACASSGRNILGKGDSGWEYAIENDSNSLLCFNLFTNFGSPYGTISKNMTMNDGQWHHYVMVIDYGVSLSGYVDGVLVASTTTFSGSMLDTGSSLRIGDRGDGNYFSGSIDEVRAYNRTLSSSEIQSLYDAGASDKINSSVSQNQGTGRLDSGLAGYWKLDDGSGTTAVDSSTNANNGTLTNGPTWTTGQIGSGVVFDGSNDYINVGDVVASEIGTTDSFTYAGWVNASALPSASNRRFIATKGDSGGYEWEVSLTGYASPAKFQTTLYANGGSAYLTTSSTTTPGTSQWYHIVSVYDRSVPSISIYVNGVRESTSTITTGSLYSGTTASLQFGRRGDGAEQTWSGSLDEQRLYRRALSADEVSQLYRLTTPTSVDTSLKGYWSFNGKDLSGTTAYDRSGAGNTGTLTNGPVVADGKIGQGLSFDGSNDRVIVTTGTPLKITGTVTVSAWVRPLAIGVDHKIASNDNGSNGGYNLGLYSNKFEFHVRNSAGGISNNRSVSGGTVAVANQWYHVVGVYDDATDTLATYVNGQLDRSTTGATTVLAAPASGDFVIGSEVGGAYFWNGLIDEVRVYNRVLSASEIQTLYDAGASDKINSSVSQNQGTGRLDSGLAGYWKLDDGSGTSATDSSTNGNTGTLTNGPTWGTGQIGGDVVFDGTNDYIAISNTSTSPINIALGDQVSTAFWYKANQSNGTSGTLHDRSTGGCEHYGFNVIGGASTDSLAFYYRATNCSGIDDVRINGVSKNTWHHVVSTYNTVTGEFIAYLDGARTTSTTAIPTANISNNSATLYIGGTTGQFLNGSVDEFRIYKRVLSLDEVSQLYRLTTPTSVDTSLKGYWSFNGKDLSGTTAYDRSGAGNTGTLTNGPVVADGKIGQGLSFDGTDDYVDAGSPSSLDNLTTYTVAAWIKPETFSSASKRLVTKGGAGFTSGWVFAVCSNDGTHCTGVNNTLNFGAKFSTSTGSWRTGANSINLNQWNFVVVTYDRSSTSNDPTLYINGTSAAITEVFTPSGTYTSDANDNLRIGNLASQNYFDGPIDEVRIYNRILSATEVAALYNQGN